MVAVLKTLVQQREIERESSGSHENYDLGERWIVSCVGNKRSGIGCMLNLMARQVTTDRMDSLTRCSSERDRDDQRLHDEEEWVSTKRAECKPSCGRVEEDVEEERWGWLVGWVVGWLEGQRQGR